MCLFIGEAQSQSLSFEPISTELGLSQNYVNDIAEDATGFIWIATSSGLNRFDGYTFKVFKNDPYDSLSVGNNIINKLLVDRNGTFWIGHKSGLQIQDPELGEFVSVPLKSEVSIRHLTEGLANDIWAVDNERTVHQIKRVGKNQFAVKRFPGLIEDRPSKYDLIRDVCMDSQNRLWINGGNFLGLIDFGSTNPQMRYVDWAAFKQQGEYRLGEVLGDQPFAGDEMLQGLIGGKQGQVFIYDDGVLATIENTHVQARKIEGIESEDANYPVKSRYYGCHVSNDMLWLNTSEPNAHFVIELSKSRLVSGNQEIFQNISVGITCLQTSRNGIMWAGTNGNGLYKAVRNKEIFNSPPASTNISTTSTYAIHKDPNGHLWFCSDRQLKVVPNGSKEAVTVSVPVTHSEVIRAKYKENDFSAKFISGDGNGGLWLGNYEALYHLRADGTEVLDYRFYSIAQKSRGNQDYLRGVYDLVIDDAGEIWISTAGEFGKFDPETGSFDGHPFIEKFSTIDDNLVTNRIIQTDEETFWIGSLQGLFRFDVLEGRFQQFKHDPSNQNSLTENSIKSILQDPNDPTIIWIGTRGGGLCRFDTKTLDFQNFGSEHGLPDETIYGILNNQGNALWLSTNKGICAFNLADQSVQTFIANDGLQDNEFNTRSYCKGADGELIFGGIHGINRFYPDRLFESDYNPGTVLTGVKINNEPLGFKRGSEVLSHPIEVATDIYVNPDAKMVSFDISGLDLSTPAKTNYSYQLENYDESWNTIGKERSITFTNLPYEDFILRVKSTNRSGKWSDQERVLNIHMLAPWWQKWWAYTAYVVLGILLVFGVYRYQLKRENDRREAKRLLELDTVKSRLFTNITHEFRTPITVILGMLGMVKGQEKYTEPIRKNADNLLQMVNQILDLSKLESNKLEVKSINGNVVAYLQYLTETLRSTFELQNKRLSFVAGLEVVTMDYDEVKMRHILYNLLSNALKFTHTDDTVVVKVNVNNGSKLSVSVEDSGIGIPKDKLPHIFNRFYQVDDSSTRQGQGTGIGLALCFELVKLLGGILKVASEVDKGSVFSFTLPIRNVSAQGEYAPLPEVVLPENQVALVHQIGASRQDKPLLLLVEDNYEIARFIELLLQDSYVIVHAENGKRGIEEAIERIPDIIISDVMMPLKNGFEVTETLKADIRTSHIPIILLTAKSTQRDKNIGLEKGADAYLNKPFDKAELQIRLNKLIELRKTLISKFKGLKESPEKSDQLENQFLGQVKTVVLENLDQTEFKVEDLERAMNLSRMQLYRKLKALTGSSPNSVVRDIRLNEAVALLRANELNISEVAYAVGFSDPSYFTRAFKDKFGMAPSKYQI